jgi:hypothetical protein
MLNSRVAGSDLLSTGSRTEQADKLNTLNASKTAPMPERTAKAGGSSCAHGTERDDWIEENIGIRFLRRAAGEPEPKAAAGQRRRILTPIPAKQQRTFAAVAMRPTFAALSLKRYKQPKTTQLSQAVHI